MGIRDFFRRKIETSPIRHVESVGFKDLKPFTIPLLEIPGCIAESIETSQGRSSASFGIDPRGPEAIRQAADIGVSLACAAFNIDPPNGCDFITNRQMELWARRSEGSSSSNSDQGGNSYIGRYDPATGNLVLNSDLLMNLTNRDFEVGVVSAAATSVHELIHPYFSVENSVAGSADPTRINESFVEFTALTVVREYASSDALSGVPVAYESGVDFLSKVADIVGDNAIIDALVQKDVSDLATKFDSMVSSADPSLSFSGLLSMTDPNGNWDAAMAAQWVDNALGQLEATGFERKEPESLNVLAGSAVAKAESDIRARIITDFVDVAKDFYPDADLYSSADVGIISRTPNNFISEGRLSVVRPSDGLVNYTSADHSDYDPVIQQIEMKLDDPKRASRLLFIKLPKLGSDDAERAEEKAKALKFRVPKIDRFDDIKSLEDLLTHLATNYPSTEGYIKKPSNHSEYHWNFVIRLTETLVKIETGRLFPVVPREIAKKVHEECLEYQEKHFVQPLAWQIVGHLIQKIIRKTRTNPLKKYKRALEVSNKLVLGTAGLKPFESTLHKLMVERTLGSFVDRCDVNMLIKKAQKLAQRLAISEPTCQDVCTLVKLIQERLSSKPKVDEKLLDMAIDLVTNEFYKSMDFGWEIGKSGKDGIAEIKMRLDK